VRPGVTFDALAAERTVRWAVMLACLPVLQVWGNMALHAALGLDWLGTRPMLADPTFVGGFGHLRIGLAHWVPVFAGLMPLLTLLNLVLIPGMAQLMSRLWHWVPYWTLFVGAWSFVLQLYYGPKVLYRLREGRALLILAFFVGATLLEFATKGTTVGLGGG